MAVASRLSRVPAQPSAVPARDRSMKPDGAGTKIEFQDVTKAFGAGSKRMVALDHANLTIHDGDFVSILGESGCGKTTLLRIAAGLLPATSGRVLMDGAPVTKPTRSIGFVFQQSVLLEWRTVLENILLPIEIFKLRP